MGSVSTQLAQNPDPADAYESLFDALGKAYWDATTIENKDLLHGTQEAVGDIITACDEQDLTTNTQLFIQLTPKIKAINTALTEIQSKITKITSNINTASTVIAAISRAMSLFPALA